MAKFRALGRSRRQREGESVLPTTSTTTDARSNADANLEERAADSTDKKREGFSRYLWGNHPISYGHAQKPTFKQWLIATYPDLISLAIFGALDWGVFEAPPPLERNFPITFSAGQDASPSATGDMVYPTFAYPVRDQFVPSWAASLAAVGVPIVTILLFNLSRIRSFWDANNGILGVLYSLVLSTLFQVTVKTIVGGLRPHWLSMCQPDLSLAASHNSSGLNGVGWGGVMYTSEICTSPDSRGVKNSLESFPSGHTTAVFSGFVYLFLYLNAKLKVWSDYHPSMWKLGVLYAPILAATLVGGSLTVDQSHNWYDVLAGATIGTVFAFSAYRCVYAGVWDWRINHIPLHRGRALDFEEGCELYGATMTRKVGWGDGRVRGVGGTMSRARNEYEEDRSERGGKGGMFAHRSRDDDSYGTQGGGDEAIGARRGEHDGGGAGLMPPRRDNEPGSRPSSSVTAGDNMV